MLGWINLEFWFYVVLLYHDFEEQKPCIQTRKKSPQLVRNFIFYRMKSVQKHSQILRLVYATLAFLFIFTFNLSAQGDVKAGKSLFNANCAACHKLDKKLVGPALGKISERREMDWLKAWIKNNNCQKYTSCFVSKSRHMRIQFSLFLVIRPRTLGSPTYEGRILFQMSRIF